MRMLMLAMVVAGCSGSSVLEAADYYTGCDMRSRCTPAYFGDVCVDCRCPNAAINVSDRALYAADTNRAELNCGPKRMGCGPCPETSVTCENDHCGLQ